MAKWNILSPDGIPTSVEDFNSKKEMLSFFVEWKNRFKGQGYYSSNNWGRIDLEDLDDFCEIIKV
jgi:hypothetical protein